MSSSSYNSTMVSNDGNSMVQSKRAKFLSTYLPFQQWSLPDSLIYYITKNPSTPKCYQKMIQNCKYFFIKNPILTVSSLSLVYFDNQWCESFGCKRVDLRKFSSKIWVTSEIRIHNIPKNRIDQYFSSMVIPKIYQSDIKELTILCQIFSFNDLQFLATSKCEKIWFTDVTVTNENGNVVGFENIVAVLPNVKFIGIDFGKLPAKNTVTSKTVSELLKIPHFSNLTYFSLYNIPETFDIDAFFSSYIMNNTKTQIDLTFYGISEKCKNRISTIINKILSTDNHQYKVPYISIYGFPFNQKLYDLSHQN